MTSLRPNRARTAGQRWLLAFLAALLLAACAPAKAAPPALDSASALAKAQTAAPPAGIAEVLAASSLDPAHRPAPAAEPVQFSGEAALAHVRQLSDTIGPRAAGSPGADAGADYIAQAFATYGYRVERQPFTFPRFEERQVRLTVGEDEITAHALVYSAPGNVSGPLVAAGYGAPADFPPSVADGVALIERGANITFKDKAEAAARAGARAAIIFNSASTGFTGSLQVPASIPVVAISGADSRRLREQLAAGPLEARLVVDAAVEERQTANVVASLPGSGDRTVVVGAHYDSVPISPGANDNASGTATMLELARVFAPELQAQRVDAAASQPPRATIRFVAFGAEELGLLGSDHYLQQLSPDERAHTAAMFNFDMVGVGDELLVGGDGTLAERSRGLAAGAGETVGQLNGDFVGRSDQAPFLAAGIPAVFFYVSDDPHYHTPGDVAGNVSAERLAEVGTLAAELIREVAR